MLGILGPIMAAESRSLPTPEPGPVFYWPLVQQSLVLAAAISWRINEGFGGFVIKRKSACRRQLWEATEGRKSDGDSQLTRAATSLQFNGET